MQLLIFLSLFVCFYIGFTYSKIYEFHVTLAYRILPINDSGARSLLAATKNAIHKMLVDSGLFSLLPIGPPELCTFEDMSAYQKISNENDN